MFALLSLPRLLRAVNLPLLPALLCSLATPHRQLHCLSSLSPFVSPAFLNYNFVPPKTTLVLVYGQYCSPSQATANLLSISIDLPPLYVSYKWENVDE